VSVFGIIWFKYYAADKVDRQGAIFHVHARLGKNKDQGLEHEMRNILREKGLRQEDPYEEMISRADVLEFDSSVGYDEILEETSKLYSEKLGRSTDELYEMFSELDADKIIPIASGVALNHARIDADILPEMVLVRIKGGLKVDKLKKLNSKKVGDESLKCLLFFISPDENAGQHLRILAHIAEMVSTKNFLNRWIAADNEEVLREILLRDERFIRLILSNDDGTSEYVGKMIKDISLPGQSLITIIRRNDQIKIPHGITVLQEDDEVSIIGEIEDIKSLKKLLN